jgi:hypothetical protein
MYVGWQVRDFSLFPSAYATSIVKQFNIPFTPTPSPGSAFSLPKETGPSTPSGLSTGAKTGIGVGAAFGFILLLGIAIFCLCIRRRRKHKRAARTPGNDLPEMISEQQRASKTTVSDAT